MNKQELQKFIGKRTLTLAEAMRRMDENATGILFLTDAENRLLACITDGDVRRYLLAGGSINDKALKAANRHPKFAYSEE